MKPIRPMPVESFSARGRWRAHSVCALGVVLTILAPAISGRAEQSLSNLRQQETALVNVIESCTPAFVFIGGGSGFIISKEGLILTNEHVVAVGNGKAPRTEIQVVLTGGRHMMADVLGHDPGGDLALLKLREPPGVEPMRLGDSGKLKVGQRVFALGDPFLLASDERFLKGAPPTYEPSISYGIISALHRFSDTYFDAIQVDVAVNRGNSGGPLINLDGEVIGINGKIETRFEIGINTGVGYAIPMRQIQRFLGPLENAEGDEVHHGSILGLVLHERAQDTPGLPVRSVEPESLAERIGFRRGDRILELAGHAVPTRYRYQGILGTYPAGSEVSVRVARGSETIELQAPLVEDGPAFLGLDPAINAAGVRVRRVDPGRAASRGGVKRDDVIVALDGNEVRNIPDLRRLVNKRRPGEVVRLTLVRMNDTVELEVRLGGKGTQTR